MSAPKCIADGCGKPAKTRGLCGMHVERARRNHGSLDLLPRPTAEQRFWAKVDKSGECWLWTGKRINTGYGSFLLDGRMQLAHRVAFTWERGAIPDGLVLDHLCCVKACVRPSHLEAVTHRENVLRCDAPSSVAYRENRCRAGHAYTPQNTYLHNGHRKCRECTLRRRRERDQAKRAARQGGEVA